jgi:hypothetical protein
VDIEKMKTSLYRHYNSVGELLYVGISLSALKRLGQHKNASHWFDSISSVKIEHFDNRLSAQKAETEAIVIENPKHNVQKRTARKQEKELEKVNESRKELVQQVVKVDPLYEFSEASKRLKISTQRLRQLCRVTNIDPFVFPEDVGKSPKQFLTGWQIIDMLEFMDSGARA